MHRPTDGEDDDFGTKHRHSNMMAKLDQEKANLENQIKAKLPLQPWREARAQDPSNRDMHVLMINIRSESFQMDGLGVEDSIGGLTRLGVPPAVALSVMLKNMDTHCRVCHVHAGSRQELVGAHMLLAMHAPPIAAAFSSGKVWCGQAQFADKLLNIQRTNALWTLPKTSMWHSPWVNSMYTLDSSSQTDRIYPEMSWNPNTHRAIFFLPLASDIIHIE